MNFLRSLVLLIRLNWQTPTLPLRSTQNAAALFSTADLIPAHRPPSLTASCSCLPTTCGSNDSWTESAAMPPSLFLSKMPLPALRDPPGSLSGWMTLWVCPPNPDGPLQHQKNLNQTSQICSSTTIQTRTLRREPTPLLRLAVAALPSPRRTSESASPFPRPRTEITSVPNAAPCPLPNGERDLRVVRPCATPAAWDGLSRPRRCNNPRLFAGLHDVPCFLGAFLNFDQILHVHQIFLFIGSGIDTRYCTMEIDILAILSKDTVRL